jgi:hypothetical protein
MALAVSMTFTFKDNKGKTAPCKIHVPSTFSVAQYIEFAQAAAQILANLSSAKLVNVSISVGVDLSAATIRSVASTTADIFQKAVVSVRSIVSGLFARFNIPTIQDSIVIEGTDQLDTSDADVAALVIALEDGISVGSPAVIVTPRDLRGNVLDTVSSTREIFLDAK